MYFPNLTFPGAEASRPLNSPSRESLPLKSRVAHRSEEIGQQGGSLSGIGGIRLPKLRAHPLLLHAELEPEREEDEDDNDEPAHLRDCNRHAKEPGQNAGVDGVTD